ncbi:efflux RND transporter permease subunit [Rhizobium yanglingense]
MVLVFLADLGARRSSRCVAIPVSLIGTFACPARLRLLSLNMLTLFGLVLAIGIVVDDAIVVVENVERNLAQGHERRGKRRM